MYSCFKIARIRKTDKVFSLKKIRSFEHTYIRLKMYIVHPSLFADNISRTMNYKSQHCFCLQYIMHSHQWICPINRGIDSWSPKGIKLWQLLDLNQLGKQNEISQKNTLLNCFWMIPETLTFIDYKLFCHLYSFPLPTLRRKKALSKKYKIDLWQNIKSDTSYASFNCVSNFVWIQLHFHGLKSNHKSVYSAVSALFSGGGASRTNRP